MVAVLPPPGDRRGRSPPAWPPRSASSCCHDDAEYLFDGLTSRALPLVILSAVAGLGALVLVARGIRPGRAPGRRRGRRRVVLAWGVAQWDYLLPESLTVSRGGRADGTITAVLVATGLAVVLIVPAFVLLYVLDQKSLLPEEGMPEPVPGPTTDDVSPCLSAGPTVLRSARCWPWRAAVEGDGQAREQHHRQDARPDQRRGVLRAASRRCPGPRGERHQQGERGRGEQHHLDALRARPGRGGRGTARAGRAPPAAARRRPPAAAAPP